VNNRHPLYRREPSASVARGLLGGVTRIFRYALEFLSLAMMVLGFLIPAYGQQTNEFTCGSFSSSGACGVAPYGAPFASISARASVSGSQVLLLPSNTTHESAAIIYQSLVPDQSFSSTFTFVPNGQMLRLCWRIITITLDMTKTCSLAVRAARQDFSRRLARTHPPIMFLRWN